MSPEEAAFLLELLQTKGIAFPLDKCALAVTVEQRLLLIIKQGGIAMASPDTPA